MVGRLTLDGTPIATLEDGLDWSAPSPDYAPTAAILNATCHPLRNKECGDHHLPAGVMAMNRAAQRLGAKVELANPIPPLPEGAIS